MRTIRLYGHLAQRFGRQHRYAVRTPLEAIRALSATMPGFRAHLLAHSRPGYVVRVGAAARTAEQMAWPADDVIRIIPITAGAGRGWGQIVLGAALVAMAYVTGGASLSLSSAWAAGGWTTAGYFAGALGTAMVIGGVSQLLAPQTALASGEQGARKPSDVFAGAVNTSAQGNPVPLLYGRLRVGSQVISAGLSVDQAGSVPGNAGGGSGGTPVLAPGWGLMLP